MFEAGSGWITLARSKRVVYHLVFLGDGFEISEAEYNELMKDSEKVVIS